MPVDSYIARIYRREKGHPRPLVGVVEKVGTRGKRAFTTFDALSEVLSRTRTGHLPLKKGSRGF